jgi:DNA-binding HxlR family transcriptional regulator
MSDQICPKFEYAVQLLNKRWTGLIVYQLLSGPTRFNELQQSIGVSSKVLSERLKYLEHEAIIKRNVYPEVPVRIEYDLTKKGRSLEPILKEIHNWADQWVQNI